MVSYKSIKQEVFGSKEDPPRYTSLANFPASPSAGDMAYFDSAGDSDSLYVSDGGGWYKISFDSALS